MSCGDVDYKVHNNKRKERIKKKEKSSMHDTGHDARHGEGRGINYIFLPFNIFFVNRLPAVFILSLFYRPCHEIVCCIFAKDKMQRVKI